ncbi:MAG TPA: hypothetical protein VFX63_08035, partial [Pyrinomonadaceae bacterium]|nr:hypothetical protein [Pyrinomonadaceae bacterium]
HGIYRLAVGIDLITLGAPRNNLKSLINQREKTSLWFAGQGGARKYSCRSKLSIEIFIKTLLRWV